RKMARMSSTLDLDALPKTFSRRMRSRFSGTEAVTSQCERSVLVSSSRAPALMILDVYGGEADAEAPFGFVAFCTVMLAPVRRIRHLISPWPSSCPACPAHQQTPTGGGQVRTTRQANAPGIVATS